MGQNSRKLPMLDNLRIASPCSASWAAMTGDDKIRFCGQCDKHVYNLSAMGRDEAQALIAEKEGDICVRLHRRKDGTVINADCPVGARRKRVTRFAAAAMALGGAGVSMLTPPMTAATPPCDAPDTSTKVIDAPKPPKAIPTAEGKGHPGPGFFAWLLGDDEPVVEMGDIAPPEEHLMGKIAPPEPSGSPEDDRVPQL